jgi:esterase/lipase
MIKYIVVLLLSYTVAVAAVFIFKERLIFNPGKIYITPAQASAGVFREVNIKTADGLNLVYWYAEGKKDLPAVLYMHGNSGVVGDFAEELLPYVTKGFSVLMVEYRGYGKNPGQMSEAGFIKDANAGYNFLKTQNFSKIIYHGFSLGSSVAIQLAKIIPPDLLILEAGFSSLAEVGQNFYPYLPIKWLINGSFNSSTHIKELNSSIPLLQMHGALDKTVKLELAKKLFASAPNKDKTLVIFPQGYHVDLPKNGELEVIIKWLNKYL